MKQKQIGPVRQWLGEVALWAVVMRTAMRLLEVLL